MTTVDLESHYVMLRGLRSFLLDIARMSITIGPIRARARMWANTIGTLLPDENDKGGE